jgi:hypothetical protein
MIGLSTLEFVFISGSIENRERDDDFFSQFFYSQFFCCCCLLTSPELYIFFLWIIHVDGEMKKVFISFFDCLPIIQLSHLLNSLTHSCEAEANRSSCLRSLTECFVCYVYHVSEWMKWSRMYEMWNEWCFFWNFFIFFVSFSKITIHHLRTVLFSLSFFHLKK